jgi:hypothetical protein
MISLSGSLLAISHLVNIHSPFTGSAGRWKLVLSQFGNPPTLLGCLAALIFTVNEIRWLTKDTILVPSGYPFTAHRKRWSMKGSTLSFKEPVIRFWDACSTDIHSRCETLVDGRHFFGFFLSIHCSTKALVDGSYYDSPVLGIPYRLQNCLTAPTFTVNENDGRRKISTVGIGYFGVRFMHA